MRCFPVDSSEKASLGLPWALCVSPLAPAEETVGVYSGCDTQRAPLVCAEDIPRCASCNSYLAAPSQVRHRRWRCFICGTQNQTGTSESLAREFTCSDYDASVVVEGDGLGGDETLPQALYLFVLEETYDGASSRQMAKLVNEALSVIGTDVRCAFLTFSESCVSALNITTCSFRLLRVSGRDPGPRAMLCPTNQWVASFDDEDLRSRVCRAVYELYETGWQSYSCVDRQSNCAPSMPGRERTCCDAVATALDICEDVGSFASRIVVVARDSARKTHSSTECVSLDVSEQRVSPPIVRRASIAHSPPTAGGDTFQFLAKGNDQRLCGEGIRAALLGAVVDLFLVAQEKIHIDLEFYPLAVIAQHSGGFFSIHPRLDMTLILSLRSRLLCPVSVRAFLRLRTSPEYAVQEVYGTSVSRDPNIPDLFCVVAGQGEASTFVMELKHSTVEGLSATRRRPGCQLAFQHILLRPRFRPRRLLSVRSRVFSMSRIRPSVEVSLDISASIAFLLHKASSLRAEEGLHPARAFLSACVVDRVANLPGADHHPQPNLQSSQWGFETRSTMTSTAPHSIQKASADKLLVAAFGLLHTSLFSLESPPRVVVESSFFLESLSPNNLLRHVLDIVESLEGQIENLFHCFLESTDVTAVDW